MSQSARANGADLVSNKVKQPQSLKGEGVALVSSPMKQAQGLKREGVALVSSPMKQAQGLKREGVGPRKQPNEASPQPIRGRGRPRKHPSKATTEPKRGQGRPRKAGIADTPLPKRQKLNASGAHSSSVPIDPQLQHFNQLVDDCLHGNSPRIVLQQLALQSVVEICNLVGNDAAVYDSIVQQLNGLQYVYASQHSHLQEDSSVLRLCHPLIFQTFKPIQTTGDGSCMYHALSLTLTGTESCTDLLRLLTLHALVKHKSAMMSAFRDAFPIATEHEYVVKFNTAVRKAVQVFSWGTDYHLFVLSLLLDRPIFQYNTDPTSGLPVNDTIQQFAQRFLSYEVGTRGNLIYCTSVHRVLLSDGDVNNLPLLPISVFNFPLGSNGTKNPVHFATYTTRILTA